jgi:hypothetical protein
MIGGWKVILDRGTRDVRSDAGGTPEDKAQADCGADRAERRERQGIEARQAAESAHSETPVGDLRYLVITTR